jgi:hypothetical protein
VIELQDFEEPKGSLGSLKSEQFQVGGQLQRKRKIQQRILQISKVLNFAVIIDPEQEQI